MSSYPWKYILNKSFCVRYRLNDVEIYEINPKEKNEPLLKFETELISHIAFNPLVENIIIISFYNKCSIYNILNKNDKEVIIFEGINDKYLQFSLFNIFDPNIIATLNKSFDIFIWDVRKPFLSNKITNKGEITKMKWSHYGKEYIEIQIEEKDQDEDIVEVQLANISSKSYDAEMKIGENTINYYFLKENIFLLIEEEKIEELNFKEDNSLISCKKIQRIINSDDNLIENYNILIIMSQQKIYFIDVSSFNSILESDFFQIDGSYFFYLNGENEIGLKYIKKNKPVNGLKFKLNTNIKNINANKTPINIKNNFYEKFYQKIYKYICLLSFSENEFSEQIHIKNYMNIDQIKEFFKTIKSVNIFIRKDFVSQLLNRELFNNQIKNVNKELNVVKFPKIRNLIEIINRNNIDCLKNEFEKIKKGLSNNDFIKEFYIEIIKLLTIDNTNITILKIYLSFINFYEKELINIFSEDNIDKYDKEVKYYSVCFSKDEYKKIFNMDKESKESQKDEFFKLLTKAYKLPNFDYNNLAFKNFINELKDDEMEIPDFNQPIEFDCDNEELLWFSIRMHIFNNFREFNLEKKNQALFEKTRKGLKTVFDKKLFENQDIFKDKYKLQSTLYLITNPFQHKDSSLDFFCNSLTCKTNSIDKLEKENYKIKKIKDEYLLEYEGEIYNNIENLCLENLPFKEYEKDEKYNFTYLMNNYVKNQKDIKNFLKNILKQKVFIDIYEFLFGNRNYKLLDERYLEEFVDKRLKFVPIKPSQTLALSDKISLNTFLSTRTREINKKTNNVSLENLTEILNTANYVVNDEHEVFHLLDCLPYYENNCSISIETPRKIDYKEKEGGFYLELLLFDKKIHKITLDEALFILNEENYKKSLFEFKKDFENKNQKDLVIKGVFSKFNDYLDIKSMSNEEFNNSYIDQKAIDGSYSVLDSYIVNYIDNDVAGKKNIHN